MDDKLRIAPLQLLVVGFDKPNFTGQIAAELDKARESKLLRVVDGVVVHKDKAGNVQLQEKSDLNFEEIGAYGEVIGALLGIGSGNQETAQASASSMRQNFEKRYEFGLDKEDVEDIAESMPKDSAALFLLIEHLWALPLRDAMRDAGGVLLSQDFLSPELLIAIGQAAQNEVAA